MKRNVKITLLSLVGLIIAVPLVFILLIWANSSNTLPPLTDAQGKEIVGSLSEKQWIEVGGIRQGVFIRSENPDNPVILFLHGGPGSPTLPMAMAYEKEERLEKYFTVCYWDQRAAGMTFDSKMNPSTANVQQMTDDTRDVSLYLMKRFNKKKIYLMGHSWGSYLGIKTIQQYPSLYAAYIGIGQVTNQRLSEQLAYTYLTEEATKNNDKSTLKSLTKFDPNAPEFPTNDYLMQSRSTAMNKYGVGMMRKDASMLTIASQILFFKGYTFTDKLNYLRGLGFSQTHLFHHVTDDNFFRTASSVEVPVYIAHGRYDYQVSYKLAADYLDSIKAPTKQLITFEQSAHSPIFEEPEQFVQTIRQISATHPQNSLSTYKRFSAIGYLPAAEGKERETDEQ